MPTSFTFPTLPSHVSSLDLDRGQLIFSKEVAPSVGTFAAAQGSAGNVDAGTHSYVVTFVTANGETESCAPVSVTPSVASQVSLTNIPVSASSLVTARKIYRSKIVFDPTDPSGEVGVYWLVATISDNVTTSYTDNAADSTLSTRGDLVINNSTSGRGYIGIVPTFFFGETNVFAGRRAGGYDDARFAGNVGSYNSFFGSDIAANNTIGSFNSFFGYQAAQDNTTGSLNVGLGSQSLFHNTTGSFNTAAGETSLGWNTTGSYNTAYGWQALREPAASTNNTAIGVNAMRGTRGSTGAYNVGIGEGALYSFTTTSHNVAIGFNSLSALTTTSDNVAIGFQSGERISSSLCVAVGANALRGDVGGATGDYNTALGAATLSNVTTGSENTASGYSALNGITTGRFNAGHGLQALNFTTTGSSNSALGCSSGQNNTTGSHNTFVAYSAGITNTSGSYNTFVGVSADASASNLTYATAIGAGALVGASNTVVLGRSADTVQVPGTLSIASLSGVLKASGGTVS